MSTDKLFFEHEFLNTNYTNAAARVGFSQITRISQMIAGAMLLRNGYFSQITRMRTDGLRELFDAKKKREQINKKRD